MIDHMTKRAEPPAFALHLLDWFHVLGEPTFRGFWDRFCPGLSEPTARKRWDRTIGAARRAGIPLDATDQRLKFMPGALEQLGQLLDGETADDNLERVRPAVEVEEPKAETAPTPDPLPTPEPNPVTEPAPVVRAGRPLPDEVCDRCDKAIGDDLQPVRRATGVAEHRRCFLRAPRTRRPQPKEERCVVCAIVVTRPFNRVRVDGAARACHRGPCYSRARERLRVGEAVADADHVHEGEDEDEDQDDEGDERAKPERRASAPVPIVVVVTGRTDVAALLASLTRRAL